MKNSENNAIFFYYFLTYLIVCCAPIALMSLIPFWQMGIFAFLVAIGLGFSARAGTEIKQRVRTTAGLLLSIALVAFLIKSPPQQAILPDLMRFSLIVIVISSFMVENSFTLSLVHFETIFFVIFSACLPLSVSAHVRILLFAVMLFLSIFLLQLTHSIAPESSADIFAVAGSVSIIRSFFLSLIIMTAVILIAWPLLVIVPKFSMKFNLDRAGSSLVDFKIMPDKSTRLNLSPGERIDDLEEGDLLSYIRSLFYPDTIKDGISEKKRRKWQQPLTWEKQKQIKVSEKERQKGSGFQKSSFVGDAAGLGPEKKEQKDDLVTKLESEKKSLQKKREALMRRILQEKKLHKMLQYLGNDDSLQKEKAEAVGNRLAKDLQGLAELESKIKELEKRIKKEMSFLLAKGELENGDGKGSGKGNAKGSGEKRGQEEGVGKGKGKGAGEEPGEDELKGEFDGIGGEGKGEGTGEGNGEGRGKGTGEGRGEGTGEGRGEGTGEGRGEGTGEGRGEGNGEGRGEEPAKAVAKAPAKAVAKEPVKAVAKEPVKAVAKEPVKAVAKEPVKAVAKEPVKAVAKEP
ncbi:MAG: hypothetical protein KJ893_10510, partial [Candidatus Omnitrophica bacterium]|nr:hypothetical protein [Candidatus Omnitrophota bacterium]